MLILAYTLLHNAATDYLLQLNSHLSFLNFIMDFHVVPITYHYQPAIPDPHQKAKIEIELALSLNLLFTQFVHAYLHLPCNTDCDDFVFFWYANELLVSVVQYDDAECWMSSSHYNAI